MKNLLFGVLIIVFNLNKNSLFGQNLITGTDTLPLYHNFFNSYLSPSFLFNDNNDNLWMGFGGIGKMDSDLVKLNKLTNKWDLINKKYGVFTSVLETDNELLFTSYQGLQSYDGVKLNLNDSIKAQTAIVKYNSKIIIGTNGNGLYEKINNSFFKIPILINGVIYDSINCLEASGNELWIGTSNGLILYNGITFNKYSLPIVKIRQAQLLKFQKEVKSIKKDKDGKLWVVSRNLNDTIHSLFILENGIFTKAIDYYSSQCVSKYLIPNICHTLALNNKGNITLGTSWGCLVLTKDSIKNYNFSTFIGYTKQMRNAEGALVFCNKNNDLILNGRTVIKPSLFNNERIYDNDYINFSKIEINDIKSTTANTGFNTYFEDKLNPTRNLPRFSLPSVACAPLIFSSSIWMGGENMSNSDLHLAAETYRQNGRDFKPGPVDLITFKNDTTNTNYYNKIWKISRKTIDGFIANRTQSGYIIPKEIMDWPAHGKGNFAYTLAPYIDVDSNDKYEPLKGDYPKIKGDEFQWWVFNDLGVHSETGSLPMGVEVHGSCYGYKDLRLKTSDPDYIVNRTLFFDYKIINRSINDYKNFHTGVWNDFDIGNYIDDFVGCDTLNNASFGYNGDNFDESYDGFGQNPPIIYCKLLNKKMTNFIYYNNSSNPITGNPNNSKDYYNYLKSTWQNDSQLTYGGKGDSGTSKTNFMFTGKIFNNKGWTETTGNNPPGDRRSLTSTSIPLFIKDSIFEIEFAYIVMHDPEIDWLKDSSEKQSGTLKRIQNWYDKDSFPSKPYYGVGVKKTATTNQDFRVFPNPANTILNIQSNANSSDVKSLEIFDNIGQLVYSEIPKANICAFTTSLDIRTFATGIYIVKLKTTNGIWSTKIIKE